MQEITMEIIDGHLVSPKLLPVVYEELRRLARGKMAGENGPQTLSATALVHEAWLRISTLQGSQPEWRSRRHFFGAAAEAMRRILIERARARRRIKRGRGFERVDMQEAELAAPAADEEILEVDEALEALTAEDPAAAEIVSLRYFAGLKWQEIAEMTGLTERGLHRQWEYARAWLRAWILENRR
ncbi:MAG: ECF-type sigma factor [Verrucomicrobiota bacterium]